MIGTSQFAWYHSPEWWAIVVSVVLAIIAIAQPYVIPRIKAVFWPREIKIYHSLLPDLGFGVAGSAIGLSGARLQKRKRPHYRCEGTSYTAERRDTVYVRGPLRSKTISYASGHCYGRTMARVPTL
jgi:hypothetical protein